MDELKIWQTTLWTGKDYSEPVVISADSLVNLPVVAAKWLKGNLRTEISNSSPTSDIRHRTSYFYSDGTLQPIFPLDAEKLEEGWYSINGEFGRPEDLADYDEVIEHFVKHSLIVEKGSDFREMPLTESNFPHHLIKTVLREDDITKTNDLLHRGWFIISLDFDGKMDYHGQKLMNKTTVFVLGHPEEGAY